MDRSCHGCGHRSSFLKLWLFHFHKVSGSSLSPLPASLFEHTSIGQAHNRTTQRTTQRCEVRALMLPFIRVPTACVSLPRDWAVSNGSHMQQDTGNTPAPPRLSDFLCVTYTPAPPRLSALFCDMFLTVGHKDQDSGKSAIISPEDACRRCACQSVRFAPPGCCEKKERLVPIADSFDCPQSSALPVDIVLGDERAHCENARSGTPFFIFIL